MFPLSNTALPPLAACLFIHVFVRWAVINAGCVLTLVSIHTWRQAERWQDGGRVHTHTHQTQAFASYKSLFLSVVIWLCDLSQQQMQMLKIRLKVNFPLFDQCVTHCFKYAEILCTHKLTEKKSGCLQTVKHLWEDRFESFIGIVWGNFNLYHIKTWATGLRHATVVPGWNQIGDGVVLWCCYCYCLASCTLPGLAFFETHLSARAVIWMRKLIPPSCSLEQAARKLFWARRL